MSQRRLGLLLTAMVGMLALHWWSPPGGAAPVIAVSAAVDRPASTLSPPGNGAPPVATNASEDIAAGTRDPDDDELRNAFSLRAAPHEAAPPSAPPKPRPFVGPPPPPPPPGPPPAPPLTVIGSWKDDDGASVFIAGPHGVLQGRVGDVLLSEYRVAQITSTQVLLKQAISNREIALPIPAAAGSALNQPK